jgi:hypothetical protein
MEGCFMVRKLLLFPLVLIFLLAIVPTSNAYLEMEAIQEEETVYLGDEVSIDVEVSVLRALGDNVYLEVSGEPQEWVLEAPGFLQVPGMGSVMTNVSFFPRGETAGTFTYTVTATSYLFDISASDDVILKVMRPLDIEDFSASISGNELFLNILFNSKGPSEADMSFVITNYRGEVIKEFSLSADVDGSTLVEESVDLPKDMLAGDYNIEVTLVGTPVKKNYMFTVMPVHKVTEMVKKTSAAMYDEFEITIINEGNINEPTYVTYKTFPNNDWITGLITDPETCFLRDGQKTCKYVFSDLAPGDSATLSYRLDYWSIYAGAILVLVAIFLVAFFTMRRATAPVIIKRHVRRGSDRHHIVLEVRNPFYHNLSNSIVRDWVSPLANVIHHEIDMVKPLIRRSNAGTELIWKLGEIKPKETRIISYPIKTLVQGSLKMPKAYIRFNKPNGRIRRLFSRPIVIEA